MGATSDVPDADYLHYGFWLQKTADEDGVLTYDKVQTFAGSSVDGSVEGSGSVTMVTGSATYNGGATGVYVHSEVNSDGSRVGTTAGQFAADATLTATFGQVGSGYPIGHHRAKLAEHRHRKHLQLRIGE